MVQIYTTFIAAGLVALTFGSPSSKPNVAGLRSSEGANQSKFNRRALSCDDAPANLHRRYYGGGWGGPGGFGGGCGGGWGGCGGFGPIFSENVCCNNQECFHDSNFDSNCEAAVFCDNVCCNEVDANCCNAYAQDAFFAC